MKRRGWVLTALFLLIALAGCQIRSMEGEQEREIDYHVVKNEELPSEVRDLIEKEKTQEFQLTYQTREDLYIIKGYGLQNSGGYSIKVLGLMQRGEAIVCETELIGPAKPETLSREVSYPYIVLRIPYREAPVVFQ